MRTCFELELHARWGDMDRNAHMANTAFLNAAADVRLRYFATTGFGPAELAQTRIAPVVRRDELDYFREVRLLEPLRARLLVAGLSPCGKRYRLRNEFLHAGGGLAARVTTDGGWFDLDTRALVAPPPAVARALDALERTDDFVEMKAG